jgi:nitric oxide reductase NorE protein
METQKINYKNIFYPPGGILMWIIIFLELITFGMENNIQKSSFYFKLTMLGGFLFILLKSIEYFHKIEAGISLDTNIFFSFYWMLTGFHVIHIIIGLVILSLTNYGMNKKNSETTIEDIEACGAFWHLCDLIWLLLFPVLYLIF